MQLGLIAAFIVGCALIALYFAPAYTPLAILVAFGISFGLVLFGRTGPTDVETEINLEINAMTWADPRIREIVAERSNHGDLVMWVWRPGWNADRLRAEYSELRDRHAR